METRITDTPCGQLEGAAVDGIVHYGAVPYAKPPVGEQRFSPPQPVEPWHGVLNATHPGPVAPQLPSRLDKVMGVYPARQDEDCLRLEIWAPEGPSEPRAVMVFVHGGGFMTGGGALPCYDAALLARRFGVVVVNVSYRLGVLGFLPVEGLAPANLGLHDQILALRWVRRCIASFGGDPANVTLVGQSAGAFSAAALAVGKSGPELFDRAVLMSAPLGVKCFTPEQVGAIGQTFLQKLGLEHDPQAARQAPVEAVLQAQRETLRHYVPEPGQTAPIFFPAIDGDVVTDDPVTLLASGAGNWCEFMMGSTREEIAGFYYQDEALAAVAEAQLAKECQRRWGEQWRQELDRLASHRAGGSVDLLADLHAEVFALSAASLGKRLTDGASAAYVYQFDWQSPSPGLGACHCIDLPFLFGNFDVWSASPMVAGAGDQELRGLGRRFAESVVSFVKTGNPNGPGLPPWPPYAPQAAVMHFDRHTSARRRLEP